MKKNTPRLILNVLLVIGMLLSLFLVYEHFSPAASKFCTFGESLDCGIVNKSPYANLDGISYLLTIDLGLPLPLIDVSSKNVVLDLLTSNAFLGFLTLLFVMVLNKRYKKDKIFWILKKDNIKWIRVIMVFGVLYGSYLFIIQHYLLQTYCIFCLALDFLLVSGAIVAFKIRK